MSATAVSSSKINIHDFGAVAKHFQPTSKMKKALLLVDFDETMIRSGHPETGHLGGYRWRMNLWKTVDILVERKEIAKDHCILGALTLYIIKAVQVAIAQPEVATTIKELQSSGVHVMVFTARGRSGENSWNGMNINGIDAMTEQQMHQVGIHLEKKPLKLHERIHKCSMIFCQNISKDKIIKDIFDKNIFNKDEIEILGFVDDSPEAIDKVKGFAEAEGIPFTGFLYKAIRDIEEVEYDLLKATIQLVNLATHGCLLTPEQVETEKRKFSDQKNVTIDQFFQEVVKKINRIFVDNQLYEAGENVDQFYTRASSVLAKNFKSPTS